MFAVLLHMRHFVSLRLLIVSISCFIACAQTSNLDVINEEFMASDVPSQWSCDAALFNVADGCDCNCGTYDPDCDRAGANVYGCNGVPDATCSASGTCVLPGDNGTTGGGSSGGGTTGGGSSGGGATGGGSTGGSILSTCINELFSTPAALTVELADPLRTEIKSDIAMGNYFAEIKNNYGAGENTRIRMPLSQKITETELTFSGDFKLESNFVNNQKGAFSLNSYMVLMELVSQELPDWQNILAVTLNSNREIYIYNEIAKEFYEPKRVFPISTINDTQFYNLKLSVKLGYLTGSVTLWFNNETTPLIEAKNINLALVQQGTNLNKTITKLTDAFLGVYWQGDQLLPAGANPATTYKVIQVDNVIVKGKDCP